MSCKIMFVSKERGLGMEGNKQVFSGLFISLQPRIKSFLSKCSVLQVSFEVFLVNEGHEEEAEGPELVGCVDESRTRNASEDELDPWLLMIISLDSKGWVW